MMGDNRGESDDSRFWGPVPTGWIIGAAFATYWPPRPHRVPLAPTARARTASWARLGPAPAPQHAPGAARAAPAAAGGCSPSTAASASAWSPAPTRPAAGCLAGPLVAAGVLFDYEALTTRELRSLSALNDSKQHSAEAREELYPLVLRSAARVVVVSRCVRGIDARGLHKTNLAALRDALRGVTAGSPRRGAVPESTASRWPEFEHPQRAIVDGDATSAAIAAASIVAKVTRDRFMRRADAQHPGLELRRARRLLDARAPRGDPAPGRLAAAPDVLPVARLPAARAVGGVTRCRPGHRYHAPSTWSRRSSRPRSSTITPTASKRIVRAVGRSLRLSHSQAAPAAAGGRAGAGAATAAAPARAGSPVRRIQPCAS